MTDTYHSISIDAEVLAALEQRMRSVQETPNEVLRRLLLGGVPVEDASHKAQRPPIRLTLRRPRSGPPAAQKESHSREENRGSFVEEILSVEFGDGFRTHPPYIMMFESSVHLVYFQNFAAPNSSNLWYRLKARPLRVLRATGKQAFICLTAGANRCAFILPIERLDEKLRTIGWARPDVEVNIDAVSFRWRELNWHLGPFRKCY